MANLINYLVKSKNRVVVMYQGDTAGTTYFDMGPTAFGAGWGDVDFQTKGLTYTSACISRIVAAVAGAGGNIDIGFYGSGTSTRAFTLPWGNITDVNLERMTIPNYSTGSTGLVSITNNLAGGATASVVIEFVTRHV